MPLKLFRDSTTPFSRVSIILLLILSSCSGEYVDVELTEIRDLRVTGIENSTLKVEGMAVLYNPNERGVRLVKAEIEVYNEGKLVATIIPSEKVKIKPKDTFEIPIDIGVNLKGSGLLKNIVGLLSKKEIVLEFKGYVKVRSWLIPGRIDIHQEQTLRY